MTTANNTSSKSEERQIKPVFALCGQPSHVDEIAPLLERASVTAQRFLTLETLATALEEVPTAVLLLNAEALPEDLSISDAAAQLFAKTSSRATFVCVVKETEIERHLDAIRAGAVRCFVEPCLPDEIASYLVELCGANEPEADKVLILGDQTQDTERLLEEAGFCTRTLANPLEIIPALHKFQPDLVLMEDNLPQASACELTTLIREHGDFPLMPIVLLSSNTNETLRINALRVGANDFVVKTEPKEQFVAMMEGRIRRARINRSRFGNCNTTDSVTGLYNRRHLFHELNGALADQTFHAAGNGLIYCEVHVLLPAAEQREWETRDIFLRQVGWFFRCHLAPSDIAARLGGTRFALVVRRSDPNGLLALAERLQTSFAGHIVELGDKQARLSVYFGVVSAAYPVGDSDAMIGHGQTICARAKAGGRQIGVSRDETTSPAEQAREAVIVKMLSEALVNDGFAIMFQPIAATGEQRKEHYDTLLRLKARNGKLVMPGAFLPVAEKRGLMQAIDRWLLRKALELLGERDENATPTRLIVRQSMATIRPEKWTPWLHQQLKFRNLGKSTPILEFQLGDLLANLDIANARFRILRQLGVDICISCYNNQPAAKSILEELPIALIKPDVALICEEGSGQQLDTLVQHAHDKGLSVIASRIEGYTEVQRAWQSKADYIVGHFVQPPLDTLSFDFSEASFGS